MSKGVVSKQGSEVIVNGGDGKYTRQHTTLVKVFPTTPDTCQPNPDVSVSSDPRAGCSTTMLQRAALVYFASLQSDLGMVVYMEMALMLNVI